MDTKDAPRKRCEGCGVEYFAIELARFGRHKGSPYFCKTCAQAEFDKLTKLHGDKLPPPPNGTKVIL